MSAALAGLTILNPRLLAQAGAWTKALQAQGAEVIELPLLALRPRVLVQAEKSKLLDLDRYHACIFVSANAARCGIEAVADYWPQWPYGVTVFAVGQATAMPLQEAALNVLLPASADSEGLLAMPELQAEQISGKRVLLLRGSQGRELLTQGLTQRGATVDVLALYDVVLPSTANAQWRALSRAPDVVLLTSPMVWQHWQQVAGASAVLPTLVVSSVRLAEIVRAAGAQDVRIVHGASLSDWLAALL
ncbi:MAG: uroporphyrinogen-III synthase [Moraxellaceae bacterium]|nr:uroporphyrinogen-III synthase [Moraxellaceae bacterium]